MSVLRELAAFVQSASAAKLPEAERAMLRRHVADTLVAAAAGSQTTEGRGLQRASLATFADTAAGWMTATIRHTEIDDIHTRSCTTPSSVTVPAALSIACHESEYDPDTVASAIWVGTELMARLGVAIDGARILYRGLWPTYFAAPFGAAAIASRMLHLTEEETVHALSLALMLAAGRSGRFHGALPGRSIILAMAVSNGIRAAETAKDGVVGDPALLDGPWLRDAHGIDAKVEALTAGLGGGSIYPQMTIKPFCSAKQAIAAIEAFTSIIDGGVPPDSIEKVVVRVPPPYARMVAMKPEAGARASTIVSAAFQIGLAAYHRERLYDIERADAMKETAALALAGKVEIVADETLLEFFPATFPAEIEVIANGKTLRQRVTTANGDPGRALDDVAIVAKARKILGEEDTVRAGLAGFTSQEACEQLAWLIWNVCTANDPRMKYVHDE
jgi:2-methylcitrate dehydratase PrpD